MKLKFYRYFSLFLIVVVFISACFCGCSMNAAKLDPKNPTAITVWHYYNGQQKIAFDNMVNEFNQTVGYKTGILVESKNHGNVSELIQCVMDSANNKVGSPPLPNIFASYADTAYEIDKMNLAVNLNAYLNEKQIKEFVPSYIAEGYIGRDEGLKILPTAKSTELMMINKTDFDKFSAATGVTVNSLSTIEGVTAAAEKYYNWTDSLTPKPNDGQAFFGRDAMANYIIIGCKQLGIDIFEPTKDGNCNFNLDPKIMRKIWDNYYVPYIKGYFASNGKFRSDDTKVGDIIAYVGSVSSSTYFPDSVIKADGTRHNIEPLFMQAPVFKDGKKYAIQQGAGMVVTKSTPKAEYASAEFLKWFTDSKRNLKFATDSSYLPVKSDVSSKEEIVKVFDESKPNSPNTRLLKSAMIAATDTVNDSKLYTSKSFNNSVSARDVLESSLKNKAKSDQKEINKMILEGNNRDQSVAQYNTDKNFNDWLASLKNKLNELASK